MQKFFLFCLMLLLFFLPNTTNAQDRLFPILSCADYLPRIQNDIREMNEAEGGGFLWKHDRKVLAISGRIDVTIQQYSASCSPEKIEKETCNILNAFIQKHLKQAENSEKGDITRSAYAKRARTNAIVVSRFCENAYRIEKKQCERFKFKSIEEFRNSMNTVKSDSITLHTTLSNTYFKIHELFCANKITAD